MATLLAVIYTIKVMSPYTTKMCRFKSTWKLLIKYILRSYIYHRRRAVQLFFWSTTAVDHSPLFYVLTARVFKCPKYGIMDALHVNVNLETPCFYESRATILIFDRYEHDLEVLPEHLDFQTCGKQPFFMPSSSFCSIGHNDRERWFSNPGIWNVYHWMSIVWKHEHLGMSGMWY